MLSKLTPRNLQLLHIFYVFNVCNLFLSERFVIYFFSRCHRCCGDWCSQWQRRWLVVKESFVGYVRPKDGQLHCVMLFDNEFEASKALYEAGVSHGVVVSNLSRQLVVKCWTKRRAKEWLEYMKKITSTEGT